MEGEIAKVIIADPHRVHCGNPTVGVIYILFLFLILITGEGEWKVGKVKDRTW